MKFLGADSDFGAVAEFEAVGEAGGGVDVDGGAVHQLGEQDFVKAGQSLWSVPDSINRQANSSRNFWAWV